MIAELLTELALKFEKEGLALPAKVYLHEIEYERLVDETMRMLRYESSDDFPAHDHIEIRCGSGVIFVRKEP